MSATEQPAAPSGQPTVVQQTTVIQVGPRKSVGGAVALAFFFGPLGMLYATVPGACVMFVVNLLVLFGTAGLGLLVTVPIGMIWAGSAASSHNRDLGVATHTAAQTTPQVPAGWHPDPGGGSRQRYWDGHRWTDHYSDNGADASTEEPAQLAAAAGDQPSESIACESCGGTIGAGHKFCPGCGAPRRSATE